ncbi:MAG: winged helix-turn-helix transcriptional regulator [Anaerolineaceae bacterium]|nr:winged helix-turn-helix transcriptional regulator [Anaerolineaceae bacterium]
MPLDERSIGFEIRTLSNLVRRFIDHSEGKKQVTRITGNRGWIIAYLLDMRGEDVYQRDLEKRFSIRRSTATRNLQLMEDDGLIVREPVAHDGRLKKLVLTPKARELFAIVEDDMAELDRRLVQNFTQEEIEAFCRLLQKARLNME